MHLVGFYGVRLVWCLDDTFPWLSGNCWQVRGPGRVDPSYSIGAESAECSHSPRATSTLLYPLDPFGPRCYVQMRQGRTLSCTSLLWLPLSFDESFTFFLPCPHSTTNRSIWTFTQTSQSNWYWRRALYSIFQRAILIPPIASLVCFH